MAQRTVISSEGGKDDGALVRFVAVLQQVLEHDGSLAGTWTADIGVAP
jgi:hypothetical protein